MNRPPTDLPALRKRIGTLYRSLGPILRAMLRPRVFLGGSVYELRTKCGKPNCRCQRGELHRRWVRGESRQGRKRLRVIPREEEQRWRRWAESYREFRRRRAEVVKRVRQILEALDAVEGAQRREVEE